MSNKELNFKCHFENCQFRTHNKYYVSGHIRRIHKKNKELRTRRHKCTFCEKGFYDRSVFLLHLHVHTKEKGFKCDKCDYATPWRTALRNHQKKIHAENPCESVLPHKCEQCEYRALYPYQIKMHSAVHGDERPYECPMQGCESKFRRKNYLRKHELTHKELPAKLYSCDKCNYQTRQRDVLGRHKRAHADERSFVCDFPGCNYRSNWCAGLRIHKRIHLAYLDESSNQLSCTFPECSFKTIHKSSYKIHLQTHGSEKPYSCDLCDYKSKTKVNLYHHRRNKHRPDIEKTIPCPLCQKFFFTNHHMKQHLKTHIREKCFKCSHPGCSYASTTKEGLAIHVQAIHSSVERQYKCELPLCSYKEKTILALKQHQKRHEKRSTVVVPRNLTRKPAKWPQPCPLKCGKMIQKRANLGPHLKSHTKEKPHICSICGYEGASKGTLYEHHCRRTTVSDNEGYLIPTFDVTAAQMAHKVKQKDEAIPNSSAAKPFNCQWCDYAGSHPRNLKLHITRYHIKRGRGKANMRLKCQECDYSHTKPSRIERHYQSKHSRNQILACSINELGFRTSCRDSVPQHEKSARHLAWLRSVGLQSKTTEEDRIFKLPQCFIPLVRVDAVN